MKTVELENDTNIVERGINKGSGIPITALNLHILMRQYIDEFHQFPTMAHV